MQQARATGLGCVACMQATQGACQAVALPDLRLARCSAARQKAAPDGKFRDECQEWARNLPLFKRSDFTFAARLFARPSTDSDMNRRYAYRDYEILVSAQPAGSQPGWRPEICVIAPDDHWQFVPTHHSLVANDAGHCLEIGRRCAESAIQSMDPRREMAARVAPWH